MSAFLAGGCLLLLWARNLENEARGSLVSAIAVFTAASFLYAVVPSDTVASYFFRIRMSAISLIGPLILLQALHYGGWKRWTRGWPLLLTFAVPAMTVCLIWTATPWIYDIVAARVIGGVRIPSKIQWGAWFPVHAAYGYSVMLCGIALYMSFLSESMEKYRSQTIIVSFAVGVALLASFGSTFGTAFLELRWDLTALSFAVTSPAIYWMLVKYEASELRLVARQALLDEITSAVAVVGDRRQIVDSNQSFRRLSGLVTTNLLTALCGDFGFPSATAPLANREVAVDVDGSTRYFDVHVTPLAQGREDANGWLVLAHDITEKALLVEELESYDRMVAHDLRNPLIGGVSLIDLAELRAGNNALPEEIKKARRAFNRALDIIKGHLRLARLRSGQELMTQPLNMREIVDSVLAQLEWQIAETNARIETPNAWPSAIGDAALIGQVWSNYISNAMRHGSQPPRIQVGGELVGKGMARFWVQNESLPSDDAETGGEPTSSDESSRGLGMGLTIVRRIVERSGGTLGVTAAQDNRDARYWFTLPTKTSAVRQRPTMAAS